MEFSRWDLIMPGVHANQTLSPPPPSPSSHVGALLREWRAARRLSQLDLALEVGMSARHLSCVETGKAQPSRDMVARLADALEMPLRERNTLLLAAGYAAKYTETDLSTAQMAPVRRAIEFILKQQEPYPALVTNRHWDVLLTNDALLRLFGRMRGGPPRHGNMMRQVFDPEDMRPFVANWEEVAGELIRHLHNEVAAAPSDAKARALLDEVLAYPGIPAGWRTRDPGATALPLLTTVFRMNDT
ncbi:MAG TPA: helix-turn-helix transcriptional regulator, partial [Steroidobacteraceae bacterium]|nr:helix-turn-helix transcriptional regulator [Steroidobacteraceae bacterium]